MFWFITGIIFLLVAVIVLRKPRTVDVEGTPYKTTWLGVIPLALAIPMILISLFTVVEARNVGVPTQFGKTTGGTYNPGLHFKAPWTKVTDIDATIQVEKYGPKNPIEVKIADGGDANVFVSYRWRINPEGADKVYADYRNSDLGITKGVRAALVSTNIQAAINEELGTYDPLANTSALGKNPTAEDIAKLKVNVVPDYKALNAAITRNVEAKIADLGDLIDIQSVTLSGVRLPDSTQKRINAFNASVQDTKIALQQVYTKQAQADGNRKLAESLQDPNVLVSKCFDALSAGEFTAPAGFSCWQGGGGGVVIPATK